MPDVAAKIHTLLNPTGIAIVGASERSEWARAMVANLRAAEYPGRIYMVNPNRPEAFGQQTYASLSAIDGTVDHAVLLTPASTVPGLLRQCGEVGIRGVTVVAAGFNESGGAGADLAAEVKRIADEESIAMVGPNCYGFSNFSARTPVSRNALERTGGVGTAGLVFQSGQLSLAACQLAEWRGVKLSIAISSGNELVTDANDYFEYFLTRDDCQVIGGTLERIPDPERFARIAREAARLGRPMVILKAGRSEAAQRMTIAHTGSVAGSDEVVDAFLADLGVIRVDTIEELIETVGLLSHKGWPKGPRVAFLTVSGGACSLVSDLTRDAAISFDGFNMQLRASIAERLGLPESVVENPLDMTVSGVPHLESVCRDVARSGDYDVLVLTGEAPRTEVDFEMFGPRNAWFEAIGRDTGVMTVFWSVADRDATPAGLAHAEKHGSHYLRAAQGLNALNHAIGYGLWRAQEPTAPASSDVPGLLLVPSTGALSETESKQVLAAYGIRPTSEKLVTSIEDAVSAAQEIGFPVVLKVVSDDIPHKTEAGGVLLGIRDAAEVTAGFTQISQNVRTHNPQATIEGILVCEQIVDAAEFFVGLTREPGFGPMVVAGLGGVYVEILKDVVTAIPPVSAGEARTLLEKLKSAPILAGARGKPALDLDAFARVIEQAGRIALAHPEIAEIDINPLFVLPAGRGVVAGDALVVTSELDTAAVTA